MNKNEDEDKAESGEEASVVDPEDAEAEVDEEMDEGTDYCNQYFDNGEAYEEDDNPDDGEACY